MDQKIVCNVKTCEYNLGQDLCSLESIQVAPCPHNNAGDIDETDCASYKPQKR